MLRHIRDFLGVTFKLEVDRPQEGDSSDPAGEAGEETLALGGDKVLLTCVGVGFRNLSKVVT